MWLLNDFYFDMPQVEYVSFSFFVSRKELERAKIRSEVESPPQHEEYYVYRRYSRYLIVQFSLDIGS